VPPRSSWPLAQRFGGINPVGRDAETSSDHANIVGMIMLAIIGITEPSRELNK